MLQGQIRERLEHNLATLDAILLRQTLVTRLEVEAGWYAVLRVPGLQTEEETALELLLERGGGGASWWFLWFFRAGVAGGEPAGARRGVHCGRGSDVRPYF